MVYLEKERGREERETRSKIPFFFFFFFESGLKSPLFIFIHEIIFFKTSTQSFFSGVDLIKLEREVTVRSHILPLPIYAVRGEYQV